MSGNNNHLRLSVQYGVLMYSGFIIVSLLQFGIGGAVINGAGDIVGMSCDDDGRDPVILRITMIHKCIEMWKFGFVFLFLLLLQKFANYELGCTCHNRKSMISHIYILGISQDCTVWNIKKGVNRLLFKRSLFNKPTRLHMYLGGCDFFSLR